MTESTFKLLVRRKKKIPTAADREQLTRAVLEMFRPILVLKQVHLVLPDIVSVIHVTCQWF